MLFFFLQNYLANYWYTYGKYYWVIFFGKKKKRSYSACKKIAIFYVNKFILLECYYLRNCYYEIMLGKVDVCWPTPILLGYYLIQLLWWPLVVAVDYPFANRSVDQHIRRINPISLRSYKVRCCRSTSVVAMSSMLISIHPFTKVFDDECMDSLWGKNL